MSRFNELTGICLHLTTDASKPFVTLDEMFQAAVTDMSQGELLALRSYLVSLLASDPSDEALKRLWDEAGTPWRIRTRSSGAWRQLFTTMLDVVSRAVGA